MLSLSVTVILNQYYTTLCLIRNVDKFFKRMGNWDKHKSTMNEQIGQAQNTVLNEKQIQRFYKEVICLYFSLLLIVIFFHELIYYVW